MTDHFRTVLGVLVNYIPDSLSAYNASDDVRRALSVAESDENVSQTAVGHELLVFAALGSEEIMRFVREDRKIDAIRALRTLGNVPSGARSAVSLKGSKNAIEDMRVWQHHGTDLHDPWSDGEPPF